MIFMKRPVFLGFFGFLTPLAPKEDDFPIPGEAFGPPRGCASGSLWDFFIEIFIEIFLIKTIFKVSDVQVSRFSDFQIFRFYDSQIFESQNNNLKIYRF